MADDVNVNEGMVHWSDERLWGYFESGGDDPYAPR